MLIISEHPAEISFCERELSRLGFCVTVTIAKPTKENVVRGSALPAIFHSV